MVFPSQFWPLYRIHGTISHLNSLHAMFSSMNPTHCTIFLCTLFVNDATRKQEKYTYPEFLKRVLSLLWTFPTQHFLFFLTWYILHRPSCLHKGTLSPYCLFQDLYLQPRSLPKPSYPTTHTSKLRFNLWKTEFIISHSFLLSPANWLLLLSYQR